MSRLILPSKFYLLTMSAPQPLVDRLSRMGDRVGFRVIPAKSAAEYADVLPKVKNLVGIIDASGNTSPPSGIAKELYCATAADGAQGLTWLTQQLEKRIPASLGKLIENSIREIGPRLVDPSLTAWEKSYDFSLPFMNLITCDTQAAGFSGKAMCEADFEKVRARYAELNSKTDFQLTDMFGEVCNQVLGLMNQGIRALGCEPMISLPIGVELSALGNISQVDFMPMVRLLDKNHCLSIAVAVSIDPNCGIPWQSLSESAPAKGKLEFLN